MLELALKIADKDVLLRGTGDSFELCEQINIKARDGTPQLVWRPYKWFSTLESAMQRIFDLKISASDCRTMKDIVGMIEQVRKELKGYYSL